VSATCALWRGLNQDKAANGVWRQFYTSRWRALDGSGEDVCWQTKYGSKMKQVSRHTMVLADGPGWCWGRTSWQLQLEEVRLQYLSPISNNHPATWIPIFSLLIQSRSS
jgi:hypothetical protein